jgi:hypothetical protein
MWGIGLKGVGEAVQPPQVLLGTQRDEIADLIDRNVI